MSQQTASAHVGINYSTKLECDVNQVPDPKIAALNQMLARALQEGAPIRVIERLFSDDNFQPDVGFVDESGQTPLMIVIGRLWLWPNNVHVAQLLIERGALRESMPQSIVDATYKKIFDGARASEPENLRDRERVLEMMVSTGVLPTFDRQHDAGQLAVILKGAKIEREYMSLLDRQRG